MTKRILTGIKPTGTLHIGNYFGMFEPALRRAADYDEAFWFIANYHALNQIHDAKTLERHTLSTAAAWLASGLDSNSGYLYAQSDIPEIFELETILNSFTPKGWMNKAHAYKAAADNNQTENKPQDDGISMGLYTYPILMAADILIFDANVIPVGKDQIQHVEIARDIALRINHQYNAGLFVLPEHYSEESVETIPGLDGRKMSKSYDNVIPLFASASDRQKAINQIVTDSSLPGDRKQVEGTPILSYYRLVCNDPQKVSDFQSALENGEMGWGDAKKILSETMDDYFGQMTAEYQRLMANPDEIKDLLDKGAAQVRPRAQEHLKLLRKTLGII